MAAGAQDLAADWLRAVAGMVTSLLSSSRYFACLHYLLHIYRSSSSPIMSLSPAGTIVQDSNSQTTLIPHNQQPLVTRTYPSEGELDNLIQKAAAAQEKWARVPLQQRIAIGHAFMVCPPLARALVSPR